MLNLKFALRMLFKTPFVTSVAIISLALGIGANAAIFSLFNQILLSPLPVSQPGRLVNLAAPGPKPGSQSCNQAGNCDVVFSYPMFRDLQREQKVFTGIAAHRLFGANLAARDQTLSGQGVLVSGSYFPLLGIQPAIGRLIGPEDDKVTGESHVAVLSYAYWDTRFGRDPHIVGDKMVINGQPMTVIGVAPRGFFGTTLGARPQVFVPITMRALMEPGFDAFQDRRSYWAYLFARLKPGESIQQARTGLNVLYHNIINTVEVPLQKGMSDQTLAKFRTKLVTVEPGAHGQTSLSRDAQAPLTLLLGVTFLVLLIACANIANLLLARSAARAGEMAVRLSIGAGRLQLIGQLLIESCLLACLGGLAGLVVAHWTLHVISTLLPAEQADTLDFTLNAGALWFSAGLTIGTGLLFGLFPALHSTRPDLVSTLKGQAGQPSGARAAARFRTSLATAQIALSMALLVAAGLFTKSLDNVSRINLGLRADHVITFGISPELNGYTPQRSQALFQQVEDQLAALPGATAVSDSMVPLLSGDNWGSDVSVEGYQAGPDTDMNSRYNEVGPGYFHTLGIPLIAGREFTRADTLPAQKVAIVNEAFAKKFNIWPDAVGKHIGRRSGSPDTLIVGLVQNAKYSDVKDKVPPLFFHPYMQDKDVGSMFFFVRTVMDPHDFIGNIPKVMARLDPNLPVEDLRTLPEQVKENVFLDRMISVLSTAFALLATLLAAVGLYGVLAYTVSQRTKEIGLRMALGADASRVRLLVLRQVGLMTLVGGLIGIAGAVGLGRLAQSLLYQLQGWDPVVLLVSAVALTLVALGAGLIPAQRASRVDPMTALRYE
ncbi:MAG: ABC transporter permease [Acidobacteriota bacterium]|nr:ABC transporter permease [Acidobacteriota bacterium]